MMNQSQYARRIGRAIKIERIAKNIDRRDLAEQVGLSYSYMAEVENGRKIPPPSTLERIAVALGMKPSLLLMRAEELTESDLEDDSRSIQASTMRALRAADEPAPLMELPDEPATDERRSAGAREDQIDEMRLLMRGMDPEAVSELIRLARLLRRR